MTADRSIHDEADDRLTRACAHVGHPPTHDDGPCWCGEFTAPVPDVRPEDDQ